jgi:hypothetical protein
MSTVKCTSITLSIFEVTFNGVFSCLDVLGESSVVADDWRLMTGDYESSGNAQIA